MANSTRTSKHDRNREKVVQDRLQLLLTKMLQDDDNKYCVDCDSKGPRWASWNLGIFLCIRCAGVHRNLGVHISKVKSVNLDSWTPVQVSSMQMMGNSRGRAVYEARVPDEFHRPQADEKMETFIRAKYEKKKYIALEWTPTKPPDLPQGWAEIIEAEKQKKDIRSIVLPSRALNSSNSSVTKTSSTPSNVPEKSKSANDNGSSNGVAAKAQLPTTTQPSAAFDLLGLNSVSTSSPSSNLDSLSPGAQKQQQTSTSNGGSNKLSSQLDLLCIGGATTKTTNDNDFDDFVAAPSKFSSATTNGSNNNGQFLQQSSNSNDLEQLSSAFASTNQVVSDKDKVGPMSKDSIMALFNKPPSAQVAPQNGMHQIGGISGQAPFAGYNSNIPTAGTTPFNMSMASGVGMGGGIPTIPNTTVAVGGGMNFQQGPILSNYGIQPQSTAMSNLNNPFLTNAGAAGNTASTSNNTQANWGFLN